MSTTSLPIVPSKFYQVCRLCLSVVSDTKDLVNLSVFGPHNAACKNIDSSKVTNADNVPVVPSTISSIKRTQNSGVIKATGKIGKPAKKSTATSATTRKLSTNSSVGERDSSDERNSVANDASGNNSSDNETAAGTHADDDNGCDGEDDERTILNKVYNNNNIDLNHEHYEAADKHYYATDGNRNFKIEDGDAMAADSHHQSDILERIYTFLSITVSDFLSLYLTLELSFF